MRKCMKKVHMQYPKRENRDQSELPLGMIRVILLLSYQVSLHPSLRQGFPNYVPLFPFLLFKVVILIGIPKVAVFKISAIIYESSLLFIAPLTAEAAPYFDA